MSDLTRRAMLAAAASGTVAFGAPDTRTGAAPPAEPKRPRANHYSTGRNAELVKSITRVKTAPYKFTTLYSLKLPGLRAGDVVQAQCQLEVTNDLGFNVMIAHAMLVHRKETIVVHGERPEGQVISEYAGENVTPDMHHGFRTLAGSFTADADGDAWLSTLIYSASDSPKPGDRIKVERGYGGLRAVVFRNA
jgi:hypothetical protein